MCVGVCESVCVCVCECECVCIFRASLPGPYSLERGLNCSSSSPLSI